MLSTHEKSEIQDNLKNSLFARIFMVRYVFVTAHVAQVQCHSHFPHSLTHFSFECITNYDKIIYAVLCNFFYSRAI